MTGRAGRRLQLAASSAYLAELKQTDAALESRPVRDRIVRELFDERRILVRCQVAQGAILQRGRGAEPLLRPRVAAPRRTPSAAQQPPAPAKTAGSAIAPAIVLDPP